MNRVRPDCHPANPAPAARPGESGHRRSLPCGGGAEGWGGRGSPTLASIGWTGAPRGRLAPRRFDQGTGHHQAGGAAAARDAVKKEALRKAGIGYHEVVAGHTTPGELRALVERLVAPAAVSARGRRPA